MENLLFINACVRGERSRTLKLARRFLEAYRAGHPDTVITERDLCADRLQPQYPEVLAERDALWSAGKLEQPMFEPARQFAAADKLVIAAPFWDMSFPAVLKIYLERISVLALKLQRIQIHFLNKTVSGQSSAQGYWQFHQFFQSAAGYAYHHTACIFHRVFCCRSLYCVSDWKPLNIQPKPYRNKESVR